MSQSNHALAATTVPAGRQVRAAKQKMNENVPRTLKKETKAEEQTSLVIQDDHHFLGYGIASVVLPFSGGMGPKIEPGPLQRELVPSEVRKLWDLGGRNEANKLMRFEAKHALIYGISGKVIDKSSLTKDTTGPFKPVTWLNGAKSSIGLEYAGQHRTAVLKMVLKATLSELDKVNNKMANDRENQDLVQKQMDLIKVLKENGTWLVAYYDLDTLQQDKKHGQYIKLKLSTNNEYTPHPDTPQHYFKKVITSLMSTHDAEDYKATYDFATTLGANNQLDVKTLLTKHKDIILLFQDLYKFNIFKQANFMPRKLLHCKKTVWGILAPFYTAGYEQIVYLSSALDVPLESGEDINTLSPGILAYRIAKQLEAAKAEDTLGFSQQIATMVFAFSNQNYVNILQKVLPYCGQNSNVWAKAYQDYQRVFMKEIKRQIAIEVKKTIYSREELTILDHLLKKLYAVLNCGAMTGPPLVPLLEGCMPLLCPTYMDDMMDMVLAMEKPLTIVASWIVPGLLDHQKQRRSKTIGESNAEFYSETEAIYYSLQYFQHQDTEGINWAYTSMDNIAEMQLPGQQHVAGHQVVDGWYKFIALLFKMRNVSLLPYIEEITTTLSKLPTSNKKNSADKEKLVMKAEELDSFLDILSTWSTTAFKEEKATIPGFLKIQQHIRHMQTPNHELNQAVIQLKNKHYRMVYRGLQRTTFNWFTSPKGNNTQPMRTRFVKSLLEETEFHFQFGKTLLKEVPKLYEFRNQVLATIHSISGLETFDFWSHFAEPTRPTIPANYEDKLVKANARKAQHELYDQQMDKAFELLANTLSKPGILGVKVGGERRGTGETYQLHPGMHEVLLTTYKKALQLQSHCRAVHTADTEHQLSAEAEMNSDCRISWNLATDQDVTEYYNMLKKMQDEEKRKSENENKDNASPFNKRQREEEEEEEEEEAHVAKKARRL